jgi:hypothetical protein
MKERRSPRYSILRRSQLGKTTQRSTKEPTVKPIDEPSLDEASNVSLCVQTGQRSEESTATKGEGS